MTVFEIEKHVIDLICEFDESIDKDIVVSETKMSDIGVNSISFIQIIVQLEDEFSIEMDDDVLLDINDISIGRLVQEILEKKSKTSQVSI